MKMPLTLRVASLAEWYEWLVVNHAAAKEVWLVFPKAGAGWQSISYEDAVEEALCYGWIDSIIQKIDETCYARKFTPRTNTAKWSDLNLRRVQKLIRNGRMTSFGLAKLEHIPSEAELAAKPKPLPFTVPQEVEQIIHQNLLAWVQYQKMSTSERRRTFGWVLSAKRPETLQKRLQEVLALMEEGKSLGMK